MSVGAVSRKLTILIRHTAALADVLSQSRDERRFPADTGDVLHRAAGRGDPGEAGLLGAGGKVGERLRVDVDRVGEVGEDGG